MELEREILSRAERVELSLRSLYRGWGYLPYRMSRFEPYDLYAQNRSFIVGNSILTFTDTDGRLMALKPDVTMSIIKNYRGGQQKVYYSENVYRESGASHELTELMQAGLECIGEIDLYSQYEVLILACESLKLISGGYILDVAHAGVVEALLRRTPAGEGEKAALLGYVQSKNEHNIAELCAAHGVPEELCRVWCSLAGLYGPLSETLPRLRELCAGDG
ncbi:MAG: ATP phosphoribosyltransferase regulatory subunit, partial [Butyricicoccus sp.]|nr:ATP phosphoribosyltransferase regulatory subunit [Butyricicoccus sp.]